MDVRLSDEQRALRDAAVAVVTKLGPGSVVDLGDSARAERLDAAVAEAGWRDLRAAEEDGSPVASAVEAALVAEELARGPADTAYVGPLLAVDLRRLAGAAASESRETIALTSDLATLADDVPGVAFDARAAGRALCLHGSAVVSVPLDEPTTDEVDLTRHCAVVDAAADAEPVGELAPDDLVRWTALGLAVTAADLVGAMRGAIDLAVDYAKTRRQYDAAIGSFQAVQHLLADAHVAMEGSRSAALHAAWSVDALAPADALAAAASAKAYCSRAARLACETSIQVHGGIGNTWECKAHLYLRRALVSSELLGGIGVSLRRVLDHEVGVGVGLR
ncbi:MAG TPA: acyl-CoA dehydrogenase [Mycobacteriales bacterium]|jgi:alkylation response protein AidB-like acyl-CoA dehydrogenase|nr:acyl-CoA dehydrogenase [Mycobacteriales bacterium]